ncbi:MAG: hypothetical protein RIK87_24035 [Fuerstiella sp.]
MGHCCSLPVGLTRFVLVLCLSVAVPEPAAAQGNDENLEDISHLSAETRRVFNRADRAIKDLNGYLRAIRFENTAMIGTNYFAVSVGGIDAIKDLEEGRGVDPETFAALYAGFAIPSVGKHLNLTRVRDARGHVQMAIDAADGRLRYKGAVLRLYSPERLRELFDRRVSFRTESERRRREVFAEYVFNRRREVGNLDNSGQASETQELNERYTQLQPLLIELDTALRADASATSILASGSQHFFGYSVGGIDVRNGLNQTRTVDPESYAAIYARRVDADYATSIRITTDGRIIYEEAEVKMYSPATLATYFKRRDRLDIQSRKR